MAYAKGSAHGHKRSSSNHHSATTTTAGAHHARKKSSAPNVAPAGDVVRAKRPAGALSRRVTPVAVHKLSRNPRDREKEWADTTTEDIEDAAEEESESFPLYCMSCEKEFVPYDNTSLYCSAACRADDESPAHPPPGASAPTIPCHDSSHPCTIYTIPQPWLPSSESDPTEPRDIVPRAAPSRPSSMAISVPSSPSASSPILADPATCPRHSHSSAISALRSVTHPTSPPSPTSGFSSWRPRKSSTPETPTSATSKRSSGWFASTLDPSAGYGQCGYHYDVYGMDRPLAPRKPGARVRPKSIELVTPLIMGRWDT